MCGVVSALLPLVPVPTRACSAVACVDHGIEVRRDFVVVVKHQGRPLQGASVKVTDYAAAVRFSGVTASDGAIHIAGLPPGDYWMDASLLGVNAAYHCFHVAEKTSWKAKRRMTYEWGNYPQATRRVVGKLIDSQPGTGESPLLNLVHRVNVPIRDAKLKLRDPLTGSVYSAVSDENGAFAIEDAKPGIYVLHVEGGTSGRDYDGTDVLLDLSPSATRDTLILERRDAGGGSCGGTSLRLLDSRTFPSR
jgi:hypothetical protein